MRSRIHYLALALALSVAACDKDIPTGANSTESSTSPAQVHQTGGLLSNIPISTQNFTGTLTITRFSLDRRTGDLRVSGFVLDQAGNLAGRFTNVIATLIDPTQNGVCEILELDIGAIHLDVLGLVIDLAPIHLDIVAEPGPGNLLGNLLCALAGLLDDFPGALQQILALISQINALLR